MDANGKPTADHIATLVDMYYDPSLTPDGVTLRSLGQGGQSVGESRFMIERYLRERGDATIKTVKDLSEHSKALTDTRPDSGNNARGGGGGGENNRNAMTLDNADRWLTRFAVQQIVLLAMEDMKLDAMITPTGNIPPVHPRPAAGADAQRTRAVDLELPRHPGLPAAWCTGRIHHEGVRPGEGQLGAGRHAAHRADTGQTAAVSDALRPSVRRAGALPYRLGLRAGDPSPRAATGLRSAEVALRSRRINMGPTREAARMVQRATTDYVRTTIDRSQGRSVVMTAGGIAASEHPLASQAGASILARGGHAVDAAIAVNAVMGVVAPMMNGIGGDLFAIVYDAASGELHGINGSGCAPAALTIDRLRAQGITAMPQSGIHSVTIPGAVAAWSRLQRTLRHASGSPTCWHRRSAIAEAGLPGSGDHRGGMARQRAAPAGRPRNRRASTCRAAGRRASGEIFRNPDLATTYRLLARGGRDAFYRGEIAQRIVGCSTQHGGALDRGRSRRRTTPSG